MVVAETGVLQRSSDDPGVVFCPLSRHQMLNRRPAEMDDLGTRLGIGEAEELLGKVDIVPAAPLLPVSSATITTARSRFC